jgi:peroxiredoxin
LREAHSELTTGGAAGTASIVAIAPDDVAGLKKHLATNTYPFTVLADADGSVFEAYDVTSRMISLGQQPGLFVIGTDGNVAFDAIGNQQWDLVRPKELAAELRKLGA